MKQVLAWLTQSKLMPLAEVGKAGEGKSWGSKNWVHHYGQVMSEACAEQAGERELSNRVGGLLLRKMVLAEDLNLGIANIKEGFEWYFMKLVRPRNLIERRGKPRSEPWRTPDIIR